MAAIIAAAMSAAPASAQPDAKPIKAATPCALAGVLLHGMVGGSWPTGFVYDTEPFKPISITGSGRRASPLPKLPDLVARWEAAGPGNLFAACPAVAKGLPAKVRLATDADRAAVRGIQHGPYLHQVSPPVVSASGQDLLIEFRSRCAGLCGSGMVRHFRKTRAGWVEQPWVVMINS